MVDFIIGITMLGILAAIVGVIKPYIKGWTRKKFLLAIVGLFVIQFVGVGVVTAMTPEPPKTAEQITQETEEKAQKEKERSEAKARQDTETQATLLAIKARDAIKASARNPDSVVFEETRVNEDGSLICITLRAQNGFGGMNREHIAFSNLEVKESAAFWNANCIQPLRKVY